MGTVTENYTYNTNGKLIKVSDAFGNRITGIAYKDNSGTVVSVTDSDGGVTGYAYSGSDNSVTVSKDNEVTERRVYNRYNYPTVTETADGKTLSYNYNLNGDKIRTAENSTVKSRTVYDNYGRIRQQISGNEYNADYDSLNAAQSTDNYTDGNAGMRYYYGTNGKLSQVKASCLE